MVNTSRLELQKIVCIRNYQEVEFLDFYEVREAISLIIFRKNTTDIYTCICITKPQK